MLERFHSWPESLRASLTSRRLSRYPESKASSAMRDKGEREKGGNGGEIRRGFSRG